MQHPGRRSDSLAPERICRSVCRRLAPQAAWRAQQCHLPLQPRLVPSCTVRHGAGAPPSSALPAWRARTKPPEGVPSAGRPFCLRGARERPSAAGAVRLRGLVPPLMLSPLSKRAGGAAQAAAASLRHAPTVAPPGLRSGARAAHLWAPRAAPTPCAWAAPSRRQFRASAALAASRATAPRPFVCQETGRQVGSSAPLLTISRQPITIHQRATLAACARCRCARATPWSPTVRGAAPRGRRRWCRRCGLSDEP